MLCASKVELVGKRDGPKHWLKLCLALTTAIILLPKPLVSALYQNAYKMALLITLAGKLRSHAECSIFKLKYI